MRSLYSLYCLTLCFFLAAVPAFSENYGTIWGHCRDSSGQPIVQARIILSHSQLDLQKTLQSNASGGFHITGLPAGLYAIRVEKVGFPIRELEHLALLPSETLYMTVSLDEQKPEGSYFQINRVNFSNNLFQTILTESQIHDSPSAHNVWSLIENQDLSATTDRIDVGGLWGNQPALFGARGGTSWTQNTYSLNGLDITDPYQTGLPLFFPDFFSLQYTQLANAGHQPFSLSPGGHLNLMTREETPVLTGSISSFYIHKNMQSSNITPLLEREGIFESHSFDQYADGNIRFSGPILPGKLYFYASASTFNIRRDLADYPSIDKSLATSGLMSLKWRWADSYLRFLWTGQVVSDPSYGAGRNIPYSTTNNNRDLFNILQLIWNSRIADKHVLEAGLSFGLGDLRSKFQSGNFLPFSTEKFTGISSGIAPLATESKRRSLTFQFKGESLFPEFIGAQHKLLYGFRFQYVSASSQLDVLDGLHLHTFEGTPLEVALFNTPVFHKEAAYHLNVYLQEAMTFSDFFSLYLGLHAAMSKGWSPQAPGGIVTNNDTGNTIEWLNFSPRFGLIFPLSPTKKSVLKFSAARYYHTLPLSYLAYGNPDSLGIRVFTWNDDSQDGLFQPEEQGILLRREGPLYSQIDSELDRPFTDELQLSYVLSFGSDWTLSVGGFFRRAKNLIETTNTGIPSTSYEPVEVLDLGDDRIPNTPDDLTFTVYNQYVDSFGEDFFLLTNPDADNRVSRYYGLDLTLVKRYGERFTFFLSLTAVNAKAKTNPGNSAWENDEGVVGSLYDNPNTLINAEGRPRFDRGYTGRLGLSYLAPLGIRIGLIIKYYDGQAFSRQIIVTGMNQGPFVILAHPRGVARYEYNRTIDIRIEKVFHIGKSRFRIILDGFNITNRSLATEENEWTGPEFPLRFATEVQSPRVFRFGLAYDF